MDSHTNDKCILANLTNIACYRVKTPPQKIAVRNAIGKKDAGKIEWQCRCTLTLSLCVWAGGCSNITADHWKLGKMGIMTRVL